MATVLGETRASTGKGQGGCGGGLGPSPRARPSAALILLQGVAGRPVLYQVVAQHSYSA